MCVAVFYLPFNTIWTLKISNNYLEQNVKGMANKKNRFMSIKLSIIDQEEAVIFNYLMIVHFIKISSDDN